VTLLSEPFLKPKPLQAGDTIAVISPAGPADKQRYNAGLKQLDRLGFKVLTGCHADGRHAYFSANDSERLGDLTWAFSNPDIKAVFCSRGGYGSGRLLSEINYDLIRQNPKPFIGFSDTTALNWAFLAKTGLASFSGPTVCEFGDGLPTITLRSFEDQVCSESPCDILWEGALTAIRPGSATGRLLPGCLSIIMTLIGTSYMPDLNGAILLIEDVGESPYRIDRMLTHLKNAGVLDRISALLIGNMVDCWEKTKPDQHLSIKEILLDLTSSRPIPIYSGIPYGHHIERITLPVGKQADISEENGLHLHD